MLAMHIKDSDPQYETCAVLWAIYQALTTLKIWLKLYILWLTLYYCTYISLLYFTKICIGVCYIQLKCG